MYHRISWHPVPLDILVEAEMENTSVRLYKASCTIGYLGGGIMYHWISWHHVPSDILVVMYKRASDDKNSYTVHTTRPDGTTRVTKCLVRLDQESSDAIDIRWGTTYILDATSFLQEAWPPETVRWIRVGARGRPYVWNCDRSARRMRSRSARRGPPPMPKAALLAQIGS